ncbi:c-type cytochrome [Polynucleobacter sp. UK-Kesae-W10]|uniref:c-type cytochrome n=1 Tax=Polynucleobacter sp. UK-Kesae-W10 TaxID=1819738 RepID=UPI001C0C37ED|nr:c-type cytochrome [Polynucleobacter sp. UK-Kesae-W10]MBU3576972.1 c-type cytochrome [Polynucleobacter sp. UK-Kesae-W10]
MKLSSSTKAILGVAFFTILFHAGSVLAAPPDAVAGKAKAQTCFACHGENGIGISPEIPNLAAQPPLSITYQLIQFRGQQRKGGAMEALAAGLSDQDMRDIAAYYAALPAPPAKSGNAEKIAKGQQISNTQYCNSCHGPQLQGQKHIARLAGQSSEYLVTQLKNIRSGSRVDMDGTMGSAARGLSDDDIEALAAYAASLN